MFIKYENISNEVTIDVRTVEEFNDFSIFKYNVPIINKTQHNRIKKFYPLALFILFKNLILNRKKIKQEFLELSQYGINTLIIGCSRGRLRSPIMCMYARLLGIKSYVLYGGIKKYK